VPADILAMAAGESVTISVGDEDLNVRIGSTLKISLRTKYPSDARIRHTSVRAQLQARWAAIRGGAIDLTHEQIQSLARTAYRVLIDEWKSEPGHPDAWGRDG